MFDFAAPSIPLQPGHTIVSDVSQLAAIARETAGKTVAIDFETTGLRFADGDHPIGVAIGYLPPGSWPRCWYVPVAHRTGTNVSVSAACALTEDVAAAAPEVIGHNIKFDLNMARANNWQIPVDKPVHCTMVQAYMIDEQQYLSLEKLAAAHLTLPWDPWYGKTAVDAFVNNRAKANKMGRKAYLRRYGHSEVPVGLEGPYSCLDAAHTLLLHAHQRDEAMGLGTPYEARRRALYANEMLLVRALADMEYEGQPVDVPYLQALAVELDEELERQSRALTVAFGVSIEWTNDRALRELLFERLKLPCYRQTSTGAPSVDRGHLLALREKCPALDALVQHNATEKVRSTYTTSLIDHVDRNGLVHTSFRQTGTGTGRLSSADPNLQNIPVRDPILAKKVRRAFPVRPGQARVYADYSQVELRVLAWATGSPRLCQAYNSPVWEGYYAGLYDYDTCRRLRKAEPATDVHALVANSVFGARETDADWKIKRRAAKIINFGVPYGMGWGGLNSNPELLLPEAEAKRLFAAYHAANPEIARTKQALYRAMLHHPTPWFVNWAGRKVHAPELRSPIDANRAAAEREAFAAMIQGSAAELTRMSIVRAWYAQRTGRFPGMVTSTVHDELQVDCAVADVPFVAAETQRMMEDFHGCFGSIPIVADMETTTTTWAEKAKHEVM